MLLEGVPKSIESCLESANLTLDSDYFALHQANSFMLSAIRKKINISKERCPFLLDDTGNTIASTIPMLLNKMSKSVDFREKKSCAVGIWGWPVLGYSSITVLARDVMDLHKNYAGFTDSRV